MKDRKTSPMTSDADRTALLTIVQAEKLSAPPPELAPLVDALGVAEGHARRLLDAAKGDPEFKDMTPEDLAVRLARDPAGRERLERAISQSDGKPKPPAAAGPGEGDSGGPVGAVADASADSLTDWSAHPQDRRTRPTRTDKKLTDWGV